MIRCCGPESSVTFAKELCFTLTGCFLHGQEHFDRYAVPTGSKTTSMLHSELLSKSNISQMYEASYFQQEKRNSVNTKKQVAKNVSNRQNE